MFESRLRRFDEVNEKPRFPYVIIIIIIYYTHGSTRKSEALNMMETSVFVFVVENVAK